MKQDIAELFGLDPKSNYVPAYEPDWIDTQPRGFITPSEYANVAKPSPPKLGFDTDLKVSDDSIVWHEAAHALVGYRFGMKIEFIDMSGLLLPSPLCGLDVETVPEGARASATGITALAGPIGEALHAKRHPIWRQDGEVARTQARSLSKDMNGQMHLLIQWSRTARQILETDPAYPVLVSMLEQKRTLTGGEVVGIIEEVDSRA